jgi:hypothetical protein
MTTDESGCEAYTAIAWGVGLSHERSDGWCWSQDKTKWYTEQLGAKRHEDIAASEALKTGLQEIGERLTGEWLMHGAEHSRILERVVHRTLTGGDRASASRN